MFVVEITAATGTAATSDPATIPPGAEGGTGEAVPEGNLPKTETDQGGGAPVETKCLVLWDRKTDGGFPETKELKRRVRDVIQPGRNLGHVDREYGKEKEKEKTEAKMGGDVAGGSGGDGSGGGGGGGEGAGGGGGGSSNETKGGEKVILVGNDGKAHFGGKCAIYGIKEEGGKCEDCE